MTPTKDTQQSRDWRQIARLWRERRMTRTALAHLAKVSVTTLRRKARAEKWDDAPSPGVRPRATAHTPAEAARTLYDALTDALSEALEALRAENAQHRSDGERVVAGRVSDLVKSHAKALLAVMESDAKIAQRAERHALPSDHPHRGPGDAALDLDAARSEFRRHLARLAAAEAHRGLADEPQP